jgi:hypothetical protein
MGSLKAAANTKGRAQERGRLIDRQLPKLPKQANREFHIQDTYVASKMEISPPENRYECWYYLTSIMNPIVSI